MTRRPLPPDARLVPHSATLVFKGVIYDTYQWPQKLPDGTTTTFEMLKRPDTVMIIAIDDNGEVVVVDETQPGGIVRSAHLPVGRVDTKDQSVLATAQRELAEETGWSFADWELVDIVQPEKKIEWFVYLFVAKRALQCIAPRLDAGEDIESRTVPLTDVMRQDSVLRYFPWLVSVTTVDDVVPQAAAQEAIRADY